MIYYILTGILMVVVFICMIMNWYEGRKMKAIIKEKVNKDGKKR